MEELRRPWIDEVPIRCAGCGEEVERIAEVGDVWLDAGIVPFSTLGWENPEYVAGGYATGAAKGLTRADLPDHAYWEQWFPADWVSEMREQIRLWFYSQLFMSVALTGQAPYRKVLGYEKMLDETGREMHGSWGNMIDAQEAFARMGADVMRWQYCAQPPEPEPAVRLRAGPRDPAEAPHALALRHLPHPVRATSSRSPRAMPTSDGPDADAQLDRWLVAADARARDEATDAYERWMTVDVTARFESFVDDLSNWYIRCSRRRFWEGDETALRVLWHAVVQSLRVIAPVLPFLAEHLWQVLVREPCEGAPDSVFLAGWPVVSEAAAAALEAMADARRVVDLGRAARSTSGFKLRQPLARLVVEGVVPAEELVAVVRDELRVKAVELGHVEAALVVKPNLPVLGPKLGQELGAVRAALAQGVFEDLGDGRFRAAGHELARDEVLVERSGRDGWAIASADGVTVALDTALDESLLREGRVLRADPPRQLDAEGVRAGAHRPDRPDDPRARRGPARARGLDQGRDPCGHGRGERR